MTEEHLNLVQSTLGFREQWFPFTYLGVPLIRGTVTCAVFDRLLSRPRHRLFHWSSKMLSMGGTITIKHHVLSSIPIYLLQVLQLSVAVLTSPGKIYNAFL